MPITGQGRVCGGGAQVCVTAVWTDDLLSPKGTHQNSPQRASKSFMQKLVSCFCDFYRSQKAISTICQWCWITVLDGYTDSTDSSVRLLQKSHTMSLLCVRLRGK